MVTAASFEIRDVSKSFAATPVLHDVSFEVAQGEIVCLLGPSGCGKTTLLRIVAGLETPDRGLVLAAGEDITDLPVHRRGFGLMFQDFALFPHRNVAQNIAFGLRMQDLPAPAVAARVDEMLGLVDLAGYAARAIHELSGGEQQRVALARSLAPQPRLLMLDEPLGSLDRTLREELMLALRAILKRIGLTALYVTHDQQEAFAIADRVMVMNRGRIVQRGTPEAVYSRPATQFVARFLGMHNLMSGRLEAVETGVWVTTEIGRFILPDGEAGAVASGSTVTVLIRPEAAAVCAPGKPVDNCLHGRVAQRLFRGSHYQLDFAPDGGTGTLRFELPATQAPPEPGSALTLSLWPGALSLLPDDEPHEHMF